MKIEIRPFRENQYQIRALDRPNRPWHLAYIASIGSMALANVGGNPKRAIQPIDPLWWLAWWEGNGPASIEVEAEFIGF